MWSIYSVLNLCFLFFTSWKMGICEKWSNRMEGRRWMERSIRRLENFHYFQPWSHYLLPFWVQSSGVFFNKFLTKPIDKNNIKYSKEIIANEAFLTKQYSRKQFSMKRFSMKPFSMKPFSMKPFSMKPFLMKPFSMKPFSMKQFSMKPFLMKQFSMKRHRVTSQWLTFRLKYICTHALTHNLRPNYFFFTFCKFRLLQMKGNSLYFTFPHICLCLYQFIFIFSFCLYLHIMFFMSISFDAVLTF